MKTEKDLLKMHLEECVINGVKWMEWPHSEGRQMDLRNALFRANNYLAQLGGSYVDHEEIKGMERVRQFRKWQRSKS